MRALLLVVLGGAMMFAAPAAVGQTDPVVRGVLFYSPTCGHCEYVIEQVLPGLYEDHGGPWELRHEESLPDVAFYLLSNGTVELLLVDVTIPAGSRFFREATDALAIGSTGVPRLIVSNQVMIGSTDIPRRLPGVIDDGLASGGIDWPNIPGIATILDSIPGATPVATTLSVAPTGPSSTTSPEGGAFSPASRGDFGDDPLANSLAVVVLLGLVVSLSAVGVMIRGVDTSPKLGLAVPMLALAGFGVAGYLAYVEMASVDAVCGPVGDCRAVQLSEYADIAGIPIGVVGLVGYLLIAVLWTMQRRPPPRRADLARVALAAVVVGGGVLSAYLTFLEPFVIGATCVWCLTSAVLIGILLWLTVPAGVAAWRRLAPPSGTEELAA